MKYRVTANLSWVLDTEDEHPLEFAKNQLREMLNTGSIEIRSSLKLDKLKKQKTRQVVGEFSPAEVLAHIGSDPDSPERKDFVVGNKTYSVRMNSHRYFVFRTSLNCVACGLAGTKMLLEKHPRDTHPHFNLYAEEHGQLVLMTKDNILAKARGGGDHHSNYQTMCSICNNIKGSSHLTLEGIKYLRQIYNDNLLHMPRKNLGTLIEAARKKLIIKDKEEKGLSKSAWHARHVEKKAQEDFVCLKCDVHVVDRNGELVAITVYETKDQVDVIACIQAGTQLKPLGFNDRKLIFALGDRTFSLYHGHTDYKV